MKESSELDTSSFSPVAVVSTSLSSLGTMIDQETNCNNDANIVQSYPFLGQKEEEATRIIAAGEILARLSPTKLFTKEWRSMIWVQQGPYKLHFFKSRQDYLKWKQYYMTVTNSDDLVMLEEAEQEPGSTRQHHHCYIKKTIDFVKELSQSSVQGYTLGNIAAKNYPDLGLPSSLYQFKLDCWTLFGPVTVAALGSANKKEAQLLHQRINDMYVAAYDLTYPTDRCTNVETALEFSDA